MAEVCRGNVYLTVADDDVERYLAKGYSHIDSKTGKIIKQSIPTEIGPLKKLYAEQLEINKDLLSKIDVLQKKVESLQAEVVKAAPASEDSGDWGDWDIKDTNPKKRTRTKR